MKDTERLKNAYREFGNVMHVEHWYKAPGLIGIMRPIVDSKTKEFNSKPKHFQRVIQLELRPAERLNMNQSLNFALIYCNKWTDKISASTASELEKIARKKPKKDWRVELIDAFESLTYQRQGRNKWVLIEIGKGYA